MRWRGIAFGLFLSSMAGTLSAQPPQGPEGPTDSGPRENRPDYRPDGRFGDRNSDDRRGPGGEWNRRGGESDGNRQGNQERRSEGSRPRMARYGQNGPQGGPPVFAMLDLNSDGRLSTKEIKSFSKKLKAADRNDDGEVSVQELMSAIRKDPHFGPENHQPGPNGPGPNGPGPNGPGPHGPGYGPGSNNGPGPHGPGNFGTIDLVESKAGLMVQDVAVRMKGSRIRISRWTGTRTVDGRKRCSASRTNERAEWTKATQRSWTSEWPRTAGQSRTARVSWKS